MLSLPASVRVYVCVPPTDMRKCFDELYAVTQQATPTVSPPCAGSLAAVRIRGLTPPARRNACLQLADGADNTRPGERGTLVL